MINPPGIYEIGQTVWSGGKEITITSEPFALHGGEFQEGETETGRRLVVVTPRRLAQDAADSQEAWQKQQAQFRKLHKAQGKT